MGKFRVMFRKLLLWLQTLPVQAAKKIQNFRRGRGTIKYTFFYRYMGYLFVLEAVAALCIGIAMLWPTPLNPFFDFESSTDTRGDDVCGVDYYPFWQFWKGVRNYSVLAQLLFVQSAVFFVTAIMMILLSFAYAYFAYLPREMFQQASFKSRWLGWFIKAFPNVLKIVYIVTFVLLVIPFYLVVVESTCERRVPAFQGIVQIHNCRRWVADCVRDKSLFGRQLQCSKHANYSQFPMWVHCGSSGTCNWPTAAKLYGGKRELSIGGGICGGENHESGPVPRCPMCTDAREDSSSNVYVRNYKEKHLGARGGSGGSSGPLLKRFTSGYGGRSGICKAPNFDIRHFIAPKTSPANVPELPVGPTSASAGAELSSADDGVTSTPPSSEKPKETPSQGAARELAPPKSRSPGVVDVHSFVQSASSEPPPASVSSVGSPAQPKSPVKSRPSKLSMDNRPLEMCSEASAFENAYEQTMFWLHQGSYAGRVLYGWSFISFCSFMVTRLLGWYVQRIVVEDPSFFTPSRGGAVRRWFHGFFKAVGL